MKRIYKYIRCSYDNRGVVAAADLDKEHMMIKLGYAFCSPREREFNKKKARTIAEGRLSKDKTSVTIKLRLDVRMSEAINEAFFDGLFTLAERDKNKENLKGRLPRWLLKDLKTWNYKK